MKILIFKQPFFLCAFTLAVVSCTSPQIVQNSPKERPASTEKDKKLTGFNQNWRYLPSLDNETFINNIKMLAPEVIRYPGGTVAHGWNWRTGTHIKPEPKDFVHPIADVKDLINKTGVRIVFNLDIVYSSLDDQVEMLNTAKSMGVKIEFIELGNEIYSKLHGYENQFPDGYAYADTVNSWVPRLRKEFPDAKIAALHIGKPSTIERQLTWNRQVTEKVRDIDAFTYHIYISPNADFEKRKEQFLSAYYNPNKIPIWVTEYGNMADYTKKGYLDELRKLVNYVESFPEVTMALNHAMVSAGINRSKLLRSDNGVKFTDEGRMFVELAKNRKHQ
ncbi:MAG: glycosyl hydrolase 53 family protein [Chitinophagaceae bacterium]|nr:glycosyl hydrolase 53 family protein [Chitinophagaceae bacterium]